MNDKRDYLVFVLPKEFDEANMEYSDAISWAYSNLNNENIIRLSMDDIYLLEKRALDFVNDANDSMIGPYEDSWINAKAVKQTVLSSLTKYLSEISEERERDIIKDINRLLQKAIDIDHNIYFKF